MWGQSGISIPKRLRSFGSDCASIPRNALAHTLRELVGAQPSVAAISAELVGLAVPALVVADGSDGSLPACDQLASALPNAELVVIPGGGHFLNLTNLAEFNRAFAAFAARIDMASEAIDNT